VPDNNLEFCETPNSINLRSTTLRSHGFRPISLVLALHRQGAQFRR
jgi:hypothetical protein